MSQLPDKNEPQKDIPLGLESYWEEKISNLETIRDAINNDAGLNWLERGGGVSTKEEESEDYRKAREHARELFFRLYLSRRGGSERRG